MAKLLFGTQEAVSCIVDVPMKGESGAPLCLGHKTTTHFFGGGLYVTDDGYVLAPRSGGSTYQPLDARAIAAHQAAGELPSPLPSYALPWSTYAMGYSLWLAIAVALVVEIVRRRIAKDKRALVSELRAAQPISLGPPALRTKADQFVAAQIAPLLRPGESVQHQAYGLDRDVSDGGLQAVGALGLFAVVTSQRLILITTRIGAFGVLLENRRVEAFERGAITGVIERGEHLTFTLAGGGSRDFVLKNTSALSNQLAFLRDVPRMFAPAASPAAAGAYAS